jgi:hypothetical protein
MFAFVTGEKLENEPALSSSTVAGDPLIGKLLAARYAVIWPK